MHRPPFCPHKGCACHVDPISPQAASLSRRKWFKRNGSYWTMVRGSVTRFKCLVCNRGFSEQTFSLDYYVKRIIDYKQIERSLISCASVRTTSRSIGCSCDSLTNRASRLSRQCISAHARLVPSFKLTEDLAADGFQSFVVNQYFPNNIHLLVGSSSQFVCFCDHVTLRRSGRMTEFQKRKRAALECLFRPCPQAIRLSFAELLTHLHSRLLAGSRRPLHLHTDEKTDYQRALKANHELSEAISRGEFAHRQTSSRAPRTRSNPLFPVNYIDRELRKDLAEHVRQTVRFARNVNHCMERLSIYLLHHNVSKRYRINDPVACERTHAEQAGAGKQAIAQAILELSSRRRFLSFHHLEPAQLRSWKRAYHTPLHEVAPGVLREINRAARKGPVDLQQVKATLGIESLTVDRKQYLPKYALA